LLRELLAEAGLASNDYYLTNALKHFNWEPRGKRRIHKTPAQRDVAACAAWLDGEIAWLRPKVIMALSGTRMGIAASRSVPLRHSTGAYLVATYLPRRCCGRRARNSGRSCGAPSRKTSRAPLACFAAVDRWRQL